MHNNFVIWKISSPKLWSLRTKHWTSVFHQRAGGCFEGELLGSCLGELATLLPLLLIYGHGCFASNQDLRVPGAPGQMRLCRSPTPTPASRKARVMLNIYSSRTFSGIPTEPLLFSPTLLLNHLRELVGVRGKIVGGFWRDCSPLVFPAVVVGYLAPFGEAIYSLHI